MARFQSPVLCPGPRRLHQQFRIYTDSYRKTQENPTPKQPPKPRQQQRLPGMEQRLGDHCIKAEETQRKVKRGKDNHIPHPLGNDTLHYQTKLINYN